jgi:hypothetical protein
MCENDNISEDEKSDQTNDITERSYYYDDSTGYKVYQENEDDEDDE